VVKGSRAKELWWRAAEREQSRRVAVKGNRSRAYIDRQKTPGGWTDQQQVVTKKEMHRVTWESRDWRAAVGRDSQ
jgi:hypothetical protein